MGERRQNLLLCAPGSALLRDCIGLQLSERGDDSQHVIRPSLEVQQQVEELPGCRNQPPCQAEHDEPPHARRQSNVSGGLIVSPAPVESLTEMDPQQQVSDERDTSAAPNSTARETDPIPHGSSPTLTSALHRDRFPVIFAPREAGQMGCPYQTT